MEQEGAIFPQHCKEWDLVSWRRAPGREVLGLQAGLVGGEWKHQRGEPGRKARSEKVNYCLLSTAKSASKSAFL